MINLVQKGKSTNFPFLDSDLRLEQVLWVLSFHGGVPLDILVVVFEVCLKSHVVLFVGEAVHLLLLEVFDALEVQVGLAVVAKSLSIGNYLAT